MGNINYSSWSVRPWIAMKHADVPFESVVIPLRTESSKQEIARYSPSGKVPVLIHGGRTVWESLAICEYVSELFPAARLWPDDPGARASARSVSAEMHAGFQTLRNHMFCNCRASHPGKGRAPGVQEDIDRITGIWRDCRTRFGSGGPFLFGRFSIADAMYATVVSRFTTYAVEVDPVSRQYMESMWALPQMKEWLELARAEPYSIKELDY